ncbi:hypothetical protein BGZ83_011509 [Gryganskiella cystojenkinii]|nr:hypothetical protein BGZ83_011509 [Gryganskiella cystojenkinii]
MASSLPTIELNILNCGTLLGSIDEKRQVAIFKNVPYATVPERWRPAVKPEMWSGVLNARQQGPICPQLPYDYPLYSIVPEEYFKVGDGEQPYGLEYDEFRCLNLNIYVPLISLKERTKPIPVMTWIHGGGFCDGSNGMALYARSVELDQPVIVVCVNYRVNVFGFLASWELEQDMKEFIASTPEPVSDYYQSIGNWGLQDQRLAFDWIQENIAAFGGDSTNVTAFGESAGSVSVHYHMIFPAHRGLFHQAIMQSGTADTVTPGHLKSHGQATFDTLLKKLDINPNLDWKQKMKKLRMIPAGELVLASVGEGMSYRPYYDGGKIVPSKITLRTLVAQPDAYDPNIRSVLIGANKDEGTAVTATFGERTLTTWPVIRQKFVSTPELRDLFDSVYGIPETDEDVVQLTAKLMGDSLFLSLTSKLVETLKERQRREASSTKFQVQQYHFDAGLQKVEEKVPGLGAFHGVEIPYVFGSPAYDTVLSEEEKLFGAEVQRIWLAIANRIPLTVKDRAPKIGEAIVFAESLEVKLEEDHDARISKEARRFWTLQTDSLAREDQLLLEVSEP